MEIKATLNKPYMDIQRCDFVVEQNHVKGYEIRETEIALEAWGLTSEEQAQREKDKLRAQYIAELDELDAKSVRPLRAQIAGTATQEDLDKLAALEAQAAVLRNKIHELGE